MIPPINCPYKGLTAKPCWSCQYHNADMDTCNLCMTIRTSNNSAINNSNHASSYEERLRRYEEDRKKLLELSKESLVDLILKKPELY